VSEHEASHLYLLMRASFGDVFIPVLLWHGRQRMLAIGGIAHFLNALVTFVVRPRPLSSMTLVGSQGT
jgi:hypothetical protein